MKGRGMPKESLEELDNLTAFEKDAHRRFPDTPRANLVPRMKALSKRRAHNKMRRETRQKQR